MKKIAIIPARGGSKRIPNKNSRLFAGRPMIAHSIEMAKAAGLFDRIIVSTDSNEIADIALQWGAEVPFRRPPDLADDHAPVVAVMVHAVEWLHANGGCDFFCCIYPTAPLLNPLYVRNGFESMRAAGATAAVSVAKTNFPLERALRMRSGRISMVEPAHASARSQDFEECYYDIGQFFWAEAADFLRSRAVLTSSALGIELPRLAVQDINTMEEWTMAEAMYQHLRTVFERSLEQLVNPPPRASIVGLGTAQLGMTYGIANRTGMPREAAASAILHSAWAAGVRMFDTAQAYGKSEELLGTYFGGHEGFSDVRITTKLSSRVNVRDAVAIRRAVKQSLERLQQPSLWGLLLHDEKQMDAWDEGLGDTLLALQAEGLISNLGVSVYDSDYAFRATANPGISIIQFPASVFDRRTLRAGFYEEALKRGKTLFIRSIFLQGLALMDAERVPETIPHAREAAVRFRKFCADHATTPQEFAFDYVRRRAPSSFFLLGAETAQQVSENTRLAQRPIIPQALVDEWDSVWPSDIDSLITPGAWRVPFSFKFRQAWHHVTGHLLA